MAKQSGNDKVQPRLSALMHRYLLDLVGVEFYGKTKTQVAQRLIEDGIRRAIAERHINVRRRKARR